MTTFRSSLALLVAGVAGFAAGKVTPPLGEIVAQVYGHRHAGSRPADE